MATRLGKPKVLLIEDDAAAREMVAHMLVELGYLVTSYSTGDEGMAALSAGEPCDVIVTDVFMPGTSGIEISALVRRWRPKTPVVVITGSPEAMAAAIEGGVIPLLKPFTMEQLDNVIAESLKSRDHVRSDLT